MLMRIGAALIVVLTLALPAPAWADFEQDKRRCLKDPNSDIKIGGCTRLIQSGRFNNTNLSIIFNNRGVAYKNKGQYDRAIRDYDTAIRLKPDDAFVFYNRGNAYANKGQYDRAIRDYDEALRLKPDYASAFNNRGNAYANKGQYNQAIRDYDEALRLKPDYASAFNNRGYARFYLARFADAIPDLKRAARLSPKDHFAAIWLYLAQARAGRNGQSDLERATRNLDLNKWPGPVVSMFLGRVDPKQVLAQANARDAKKNREQHSEASFYMGQYHLIQGSRGKANALFRATLELGVKNLIEYTGARAELARMAK